MKVQIDVDQELWRRTRIAALERGDKLGVFVGHALEWACVNQSKVAFTPGVQSTAQASEFSCKVCGKPTDRAYVCKGCVDNQKNA